MKINQIKTVFSDFQVEDIPVALEQCHVGHINNTFFVSCDSGTSYVLQAINTVAFKNPENLMHNVTSVTHHIEQKLIQEGKDPSRGVLHFIPAKTGSYCNYQPDGKVWRMYKKIEGARSYNQVEFDGLFENAGYAFGSFQHCLADFPANQLNETIPHFHDTHSRFNDCKSSAEKDTASRADSVRAELKFVYDHEKITTWITDRLNDGTFPLRVTHNDTKLNNVLIDDQSHTGICVIDLDTVMPGSALYDFGDSIRFGASNATEDEKDLSKVFMRLDLFEEFTRGFLKGLDGALTENELLALPMSAIIITLEIGIRFLADYLDGDIYFATAYPEHNLDRARTQFKLVADMETKMDEMNAIIRKFM